MNKTSSAIATTLAAVALLAVSPAAEAAKPPQVEGLSAWEAAPEASFRRGDMRISSETGIPLALYNVGYAVKPGTPEDMARQYLRENAATLGHSTLDFDDPNNLILHAVRESGAGSTVRLRQHYMGVPVYGAEVTVTIDPNAVVTFVMNGFKPGIDLTTGTPSLTAASARETVLSTLDVQGSLNLDRTSPVIFQHEGQWRLAQLVKAVPSVSPTGDWEGFVDGNTGELLKLWDRAVYADGTGNVFDPDPLSSAGVSYGDPGYVDGSDADTPQLDGQLIGKTLLDLTESAGSFSLVGPWAQITDAESPFFGLFSQPGSDFSFTRTESGFEAAHTYFHIDSIMRYLNVTLGISIVPFQYPGNAARFDPHGLGGSDNSHYIGSTGQVAFGEGGVDDAEDADVVIHELGHALHDWVTNGGLSQVNGLSEGIGDFVASSYSRSLSQWGPGDPQYFWVFDWDGHNPFWNGRITNYGAVWPGGLVNQVHTDGQIWATCMMRIWDAIGRDQTELAHWTGIGMTNSVTNQEDAAIAVQQAATTMGFPFGELESMAMIFQSCGYGVVGPMNPPFFADGFESGDTSAWTLTFP